jgi:hypothetical protein
MSSRVNCGSPRNVLVVVTLFGLILWPAMACRAEDGSTTYFKAPDGTSDADLAKVCQAMVSRCKVYGFKGTKAKVEKNKNGKSYVRMDVEGGISEEMQVTLAAMGRYAAKTFELRFEATLTAGEKEQFKPPAFDKIGEAKAPKGTKWHRWVEFDANAEGKTREPVLLLDAPVVARNEILPPYKDRADWTGHYYVFADAAATRANEAAAVKSNPLAEFVVDGVALFSDNKLEEIAHPKDGRFWYRHGFFERERLILEGFMKVPMPTALAPVDTAVEESFEVPKDAKMGSKEEK